MLVVIPRNTTIPVRRTVELTTRYDGQGSVLLRVLEGERCMACDNNLLGRLELGGIIPLPRGAAKVSVSFDIDANGILTVTAQDKVTGKNASLRVTNDKGRLSAKEIEAMVRAAEKYQESDARALLAAQSAVQGAAQQPAARRSSSSKSASTPVIQCYSLVRMWFFFIFWFWLCFKREIQQNLIFFYFLQFWQDPIETLSITMTPASKSFFFPRCDLFLFTETNELTFFLFQRRASYVRESGAELQRSSWLPRVAVYCARAVSGPGSDSAHERR